MADKAQKDMEQALSSLVEHPGWAHVVAFTDSLYRDALTAMWASPAGKIWEHGQANGTALACEKIIGYPAQTLVELRAVQQAKDEEDGEA